MREKLDAVLLACTFDNDFRESLNEDCACFFRVFNDLINDDTTSTSWIEIYNRLVEEDAVFLRPFVDFAYSRLDDFFL